MGDSSTVELGTGDEASSDSDAVSGEPQEAPLDAAAPTPAALIHHYDFEGEGVEILDRVGEAHGVALGGAMLDGSGSLALDGEDDYVDLPNGIISQLDAVSFAVSLEWRGAGCWQRIIDFGSTPAGEDVATQAETSLFLTPASCQDSHLGPVNGFVMSAMYHVRTSAYVAQHTEGVPVDVVSHIVLSAAPESGLVLYLNGEFATQTLAPLRVSEIDDVNNWVGRSQWGQDVYLNARMLDLRLYSGALTPDEVAALYDAMLGEP